MRKWRCAVSLLRLLFAAFPTVFLSPMSLLCCCQVHYIVPSLIRCLFCLLYIYVHKDNSTIHLWQYMMQIFHHKSEYIFFLKIYCTNTRSFFHFPLKRASILHGIDSIRCWKSLAFCGFISYTLRLQISVPPHPQCVILDSHLVTGENLGVRWT